MSSCGCAISSNAYCSGTCNTGCTKTCSSACYVSCSGGATNAKSGYGFVLGRENGGNVCTDCNIACVSTCANTCDSKCTWTCASTHVGLTTTTRCSGCSGGCQNQCDTNCTGKEATAYFNRIRKPQTGDKISLEEYNAMVYVLANELAKRGEITTLRPKDSEWANSYAYEYDLKNLIEQIKLLNNSTSTKYTIPDKIYDFSKSKTILQLQKEAIYNRLSSAYKEAVSPQYGK